MKKKTFNFYCDESTHLENDRFPFMIIGYVNSAWNQVKLHSQNILRLKLEHRYKGEIKWSKLSQSNYPFYAALIDYFFASDLSLNEKEDEKQTQRYIINAEDGAYPDASSSETPSP